MEERKFKNTTKSNLQDYKMLLGEFLYFYHDNNVLNVESIISSHIKTFIKECQEKGNNVANLI